MSSMLLILLNAASAAPPCSVSPRRVATEVMNAAYRDGYGTSCEYDDGRSVTEHADDLDALLADGESGGMEISAVWRAVACTDRLITPEEAARAHRSHVLAFAEAESMGSAGLPLPTVGELMLANAMAARVADPQILPPSPRGLSLFRSADDFALSILRDEPWPECRALGLDRPTWVDGRRSDVIRDGWPAVVQWYDVWDHVRTIYLWAVAPPPTVG